MGRILREQLEDARGATWGAPVAARRSSRWLFVRGADCPPVDLGTPESQQGPDRIQQAQVGHTVPCPKFGRDGSVRRLSSVI